jgi:hypothetical protein
MVAHERTTATIPRAVVLARCSILLGGEAGQVNVAVVRGRCQRGVAEQRLAGSAVARGWLGWVRACA